MKKIVGIIVLLYLILFWDFEACCTIKKMEYKLEYTGIVWVALDYWTIWKYKSSDTPMKIVEFTQSKIS